MKSQQGKEEGGKGSNVAWGEVSGHINCIYGPDRLRHME